MFSSPVLTSFFKRQIALIDEGSFWNCLASAGTIASILLADRGAPWIGRLRRIEERDGVLFHAPLIPVHRQGVLAWTTHYVCIADDVVFDPVAREPLPLSEYARSVFGADLAIETFVAADNLARYLMMVPGGRSIAPVNSSVSPPEGSV
jgi:hypothetical protein